MRGPALLLLLALCACGDRAGDAPEAAAHGVAESDSAWKVERVTPAESARAARRVERYGDSVRAEALRRAGVPVQAERERPRTPPPDDSPRGRYESCMKQAREADEPLRATLVDVCENIRRQPGYPN